MWKQMKIQTILWKEEEAQMQRAVQASLLSVRNCQHLRVDPEDIDAPDPQKTLKTKRSNKLLSAGGRGEATAPTENRQHRGKTSQGRTEVTETNPSNQ